MPGKQHFSAVCNVTATVWCVVMLCPKVNFLYSCISNFEVCAQCQIWLFSVVSWCAFQVCLDSFWMVLRWFQLSQFLLMLLLFLYFTYAVFHLYFKIFLASFLITCRFLLKLQHLLTDMCHFHYYGLWRPLYCWGWFYYLSLAEYIIWFVTLLTWLVSTVFGALSYLHSHHISPLHFFAYVKV
jgi:hypothetical protein